MKKITLLLLVSSTLGASQQPPSLRINTDKNLEQQEVEVLPSNDEPDEAFWRRYREQFAAHEASKVRCCWIKSGYCLLGAIAVLILLNRYVR